MDFQSSSPIRKVKENKLIPLLELNDITTTVEKIEKSKEINDLNYKEDEVTFFSMSNQIQTLRNLIFEEPVPLSVNPCNKLILSNEI